jgi:hypothetical protein
MAAAHGTSPTSARARYRALPQEIRDSLEQGTTSDWDVLPQCVDPNILKTALDPDDGYFKGAWPRTERHLELLRKLVAAEGGKLVLAVVPHAVQVDPRAQEVAESLGSKVDPAWLSRPGRTQQALHDWADKAGVPYLDLTDALRGADEPLYFQRSVHFNPAGNAKAAEVLAEFLTKQGLVPEKKP